MSDLAIGKVIKMPCMRSGLCKYPNETILVSRDALAAMQPTAMGIPVVIDHPDIAITSETISKMPVVGRVVSFEYDPAQELYIAEFIIDNEEGLSLLEQGYGVSTAWYGEKYAEGGTFNNVQYDREVTQARYEHLAIVQNPRYEMAVNPIFLNSSDIKPRQIGNDTINIKTEIKKETPSMLKLWKKLTSREELMTNANEELLVEVNGQEMTLRALIDEVVARRNEKDEEQEKEEKKALNGSEEVDVDGEKMTVNELIDRYKAKKSSNVASEEKDEEKTEEKSEEKSENESEEKSEDEEKETKKENSLSDEEKSLIEMRFDSLEDAHKNGVIPDPITHLSMKERVEMGRNRYGSKR